MPEVKLQWVMPHVLSDTSLRNFKTGDHPMIPVLTLDQLETWLRGVPRDYRRYVSLDDLLAQVQAWKQSSSTKSS